MALITNKSRFYYVHRSGSVWVSKVMCSLFDAEDITDSSGKVKREDRRKYDFGLFHRHTAPKDTDNKDLFSFCFVRHPSSWYKSMWSARMDRDQKLNERFILGKCWSTSFEEFIENAVEAFPNGFLTEMYQYFVGEDLKKMDFIGRQESLQEDLIKALTLAGETFDKSIMDQHGRTNFSKIEDELEISKGLEERLLKSEKWVIDNFYKYE